MNIVTVIGNLTKEPELKTSQSGTSIARCGIAVRRDRKEANGEYGTDFFDLVAWGGQADFLVKNLRKGNKCCVSGSVHARNWTDRDGATRISVEIHANHIESLTPKPVDQQLTALPPNAEEPKADDLIDEDDMPF